MTYKNTNTVHDPLYSLSKNELMGAIEGLKSMRRVQGPEHITESSYIEYLMEKLKKVAEAKGFPPDQLIH